MCVCCGCHNCIISQLLLPFAHAAGHQSMCEGCCLSRSAVQPLAYACRVHIKTVLHAAVSAHCLQLLSTCSSYMHGPHALSIWDGWL
jgi:hypothetical protein